MPDKWCGVILAGGLGTRLSPLTAKICKPMVPVSNRPMVLYAIDHLRYAGIRKIIIVVKHLGDILRDLIYRVWTKEACQKADIEILVPEDLKSEGTADAVRKVAHLIDTPYFVVSMADIITNLPMKKFMDFHEIKNAQATVSMKRIEQMATKYGNTLIDHEGKILRFLEKPSCEEIYVSALTGDAEPLPIINTGIYCFNHEIISVLNETSLMDFGSEVFGFLLENRYRLFGFVEDYYWMDIGNPLTYLWSCWDMLRLYGWPITPPGIRQNEKTHVWYEGNQKPAISHGDHVCFGSNIQCGSNVRVQQLVAIGSNVIIGNDVYIDRSIIWNNVKIGSNVQIIQSVIANGCEIGDNCIIRSESIIGPDVKIGPNTIIDAKTIKENSILGVKSSK